MGIGIGLEPPLLLVRKALSLGCTPASKRRMALLEVFLGAACRSQVQYGQWLISFCSERKQKREGCENYAKEHAFESECRQEVRRIHG
jgi:hypothetical protein